VNITILGSTGSIGVQALDVIKRLGHNTCALSAYNNINALERQIREFRPEYACLADENAARELKVRVGDTSTRVLSGVGGMLEIAALPQPDIVLNAVVGIAGLLPTITAINAGKDIALANKETLVAGGKLVTEAARAKNVKILPVDSEHSAIFQCLQGAPPSKAIERIILTASGGPFFGKSKADLANITKKDALKHPNWDMGAKITIDSATLMNKGLELIEAVWLFDLPPRRVEIVVHRESVIHSAVEYTDNSVIAQLGVPDMRIPIQYALTYPERYPCPAEPLSLTRYGKLTFFEPDAETFICLKACIRAIEVGGLAPAAANGANEQAVKLFLKDKISFLRIGELVMQAVEAQRHTGDYTLEDVIAADKAARETVMRKVNIN